MGSTTQFYRSSKWTFIFLNLIFQVCTTYLIFTLFCCNWTSETEPDQVKEVLTVSDNRSKVTESPWTPRQLSTVDTVVPKPLIILIWTWPGLHPFLLDDCPPSVDSSSCLVTFNRSMYSTASAVVINHRDVSKSVSDLPKTPRPPGQYWIWFNMEPPTHLRNLSMMENLFNFTMSYRRDSDIFTPYGRIEKNNGAENFTIPQKTKLAAWLISNWKPVQRRVQYYEQLKKYIKVDIYGKDHMPLPRGNNYNTLCKYKFYLAFENYAHQDYITEKLWNNAFHAEVVPVVMGPPRINYERFIPPDSFIHVDDFSSPEKLAAYLLSLDVDDQKYQQYFNWRTSLKPAGMRKNWVYEYCKVCRAVKEAPPYRTFPSIADWFK